MMMKILPRHGSEAYGEHRIEHSLVRRGKRCDASEDDLAHGGKVAEPTRYGERVRLEPRERRRIGEKKTKSIVNPISTS